MTKSSYYVKVCDLYTIQEPTEKTEGKGGYVTRVSADKTIMECYAATAGVQGTPVPVKIEPGLALHSRATARVLGYFLNSQMYPVQDLSLLTPEDREALKRQALNKLTPSEKAALGFE